MCALLALAALLSLAGAPPPAPFPPPAAPAAPALVILRAACASRDPSAFAPQRLFARARAAPASHSLRTLRVLGYNETCGGEWQQEVTRSALAALAVGGGVVLVGAPSGAGLSALCASARALWRPAPAACARASAASLAAAQLAVLLRWRRVRLPLATPTPSACAEALAAVEVALRLRGLLVHRDAPLTLASLPLSYASISCPSDDDPPLPAESAIGAFSLSLRVGVATPSNSNRNGPTGSTGDVALVPNFNESRSKNEAGVEIGGLRLLLLLNDDDELDAAHPALLSRVYDAAVNEIDRQIEAKKEGRENVNAVLRILQWVGESWRPVGSLDIATTRALDGHGHWTSTAVAADEQEFERWARAHALPDDEAGEGPSGEAAGAAGAWRAAAAMAGGAAALAATAAVAARAAQRRRRARRRRADVVLDARDFTFPLDEPRRVGDGMEAMLSCWLQQLHEFGGPELERPDLLKRAPSAVAAASSAPVAPSAVSSANHAAPDRRVRFKGDAVQLKRLPLPVVTPTLELRCKATDVLLVLHALRHENLNPFIGCLCELRPALAFDHCGRGSLEDVLVADDIKLDWTFRLSLLTDLVKGLRYLHGSTLRVHGRLSSRNCVVDSRWVLRITDYGLPEFYRAQGLVPPPRSARDLLWTAPELLRESRGEGRGTQPGDIFSFAIIMQEVIVRGEPYCMLALSPEEIVEKLVRPPPLIRPSVSMGAAPPEAVSVMRQCWAEPPDLRPDTDTLLDIFRHLHRGRKINIVDSMFEMLEKYSNNLEELIKERTEQLDMEKKKTEQLLNRMLPRSVAERLLLGLCVEPEEFEEVTVYFSDIVGFTSLAARSTPVQVVALLNDLYTTFDAAIERYHVYKVETIGDAYMVVGGLPARAADHAESVATMALHLLHLAGRFRVRHLPRQPLHLRIGLHSGPCCAGVVGLTMPRYCLFGDTVNTASRMESTGAAWRIQTSATTAARLLAAGGYRLRERGLTHIKGKGAMRTYWLLGKDGFDKSLPAPPPLTNEEVEDALLEGDGSEPSPPPVLSDSAEAAHALAPALARAGSEHAEPSSAAGRPPPDPSAQYARYRCLGGAARALRRQWSLERGDALAAARAGPPPPLARSLTDAAAHAPAAPPLSLRPPAAPRAPRYRTRPAPPAEAPS